MNIEITPEQIEAYQRDGFTILQDFLSPAEVEELLDAIAAAVEQTGSQRVAGEGRRDLVDDVNYNKVFLQRLNLWKINDTVKRYFLDPALGEVLCRLAGIDGIRVWHDQTLQKGPWANATAWHMDNPKWSFHSYNSITIWVALDDVTLQNGCLYYLPGSHRKTRHDLDSSTTGSDMQDLFAIYPELHDVEAVPIELEAGGAALHNSMISHAAGPNMTPRWRRAMTCSYMPEGATFNGLQNILSPEQAAQLQIGDVLEDEAMNPLVWSRQRAVA